MNTTENIYNNLMDLIDDARLEGIDHLSSPDVLTPEVLQLLSQNGYHYEAIERDNEVKGYKISWH